MSMAPCMDSANLRIDKSKDEVENYCEKTLPDDRKHEVIWFNVIAAIITHMIVFYGLYLSMTSAHIFTTIQVVLLHFVGTFGITGGCHRLWSHRAFKAKLPLRVILMLCSTLAFQGSIFQWVRDHRVHHKCSDTHGDPHNPSVGFFFSHLGWLLCKKFPEVTEMGKKLDFQDILNDPVVSFQKKHIRSMVVLIAIIIQTAIPMVLWGETFTNAFCLNFLRHFISLHALLAVNSVTHAFGKKPYDRHIRPTENKLVSFLASGEGFHNYHHAFPWDYKASELGNYSLNFTTSLIDFFARIGWAYDLKSPTEELIKNKCLQKGDGSHNIWGWGDKDQPLKELSQAIVN